ncbi:MULTISPECIES: IclR family transcriptional regulator [Neobacillus]|uniref:Glycerol operon regulatory protein n=1 Tax=Neobacillus rhizophilus TaxID=2833579 RepID=A0A942U1R8_9BACI|nr:MULTISPECIES: IclR family transcriptional regulator [Neobacillus]MBS4211283.1 IclR family transcriptional regulator [Neobacillus rhizophilus]MBU8918805.1 IclR family transcriptional regulator [Bacillus sp. FJAT-29953]
MVQSIDRALTIVNYVSSQKGGLGVTELAEKLGLNKSSIFRILATLASHGYIEQDPDTKKYKLGYKYLELSAKLLDSIDIRKEAKPYLQELVDLSNEVIHLIIYSQKEAIYIEKLEGSETLRMHSQVGRRVPMHCTSAGKVLLAYLPTEEVMDMIEEKGLPRHTDNTITDQVELLDNLQKIRKKGYGVEREENEPGVTCMAAPIFNHLGNVIGAVSISGPSMRMTEARLDELKDKLIEVGSSISRRLGYKGE